jgi:hypothetical protein
VKLLNGPLGDAAILVVHKGEPSWPSGVAICGNDNLHRVANSAEMLPDVCFGRTVWKVADE